MKSVFKNKRTKVLLWVLLGAVVVALGVFVYGYSTGKLKSSADTTTFSDVPQGYWAYTEIYTARDFGYIAGYPDNTFRPSNIVTRDQAAVFLARAVAGDDAWVPAGPATASCSDVSTTNWAYKYVQYDIAQGILNPDCSILTDSPLQFNPSANLTRGELAVLISRAAYGDYQVVNGSATSSFKDVLSTSPYYKYVSFLAGKGIIGGYSDNTFRPDQVVTRDQMAVFLYRAYDLKSALDVINSFPETQTSLVRRAQAASTSTLNLGPFSGEQTKIDINGTVTDKSTSQPITGASIKIKSLNNAKFSGIELRGTDTEVKTNNEGIYTLSEVTTKAVGRLKLGIGLGPVSFNTGASKKLKEIVFNYEFTVSASGYKELKFNESFNKAQDVIKNFKLEKSGEATVGTIFASATNSSNQALSGVSAKLTYPTGVSGSCITDSTGKCTLFSGASDKTYSAEFTYCNQTKATTAACAFSAAVPTCTLAAQFTCSVVPPVTTNAGTFTSRIFFPNTQQALNLFEPPMTTITLNLINTGTGASISVSGQLAKSGWLVQSMNATAATLISLPAGNYVISSATFGYGQNPVKWAKFSKAQPQSFTIVASKKTMLGGNPGVTVTSSRADGIYFTSPSS